MWRKVRLTDETGAGRHVRLEVWDGGQYKLVEDRVFFDVHEHFDPEFIWYSDYSPPEQGSQGVAARPENVANATTEGWLLVSGAKLDAVKIDARSEDGWTDVGRAPKWPRTTG